MSFLTCLSSLQSMELAQIKYSIIYFSILSFALAAEGRDYEREDFGFQSYSSNSLEGYYTRKPCKLIEIDHVVSLRDAYVSGAEKWSVQQKVNFANDRENHVPSCSQINRSKGASTPYDFLRKSSDGSGIDYSILTFCSYVKKYFFIKRKYHLSFANNVSSIFNDCGIRMKSKQ